MLETATSRRVRVHFVLSAVVLIAAIWLSTGTMAPYAATLESPAVLEPCHYLVNVDNEHFVAPFRMLRGEDFESWGGSVVLRRLLFPIIALPLVSAFGFLTGGVIASIALHVIAVIGFSMFILRRFGEAAAITSAWILATYPGITYWAGLPYSYVVIVPGSLACMMLLYRLDEAENARAVLMPSLLLGIVFLGYDLLPFFGPAAVLLLLYRRQWPGTVVAFAAMLIPTAGVAMMFNLIGIPLVNSNTLSYVLIVGAYLHPQNFPLWMHSIVMLPWVFITNLLFSNFVVLPLLFCVALGFGKREGMRVLTAPDVALIIASLALFLFNNAAPPYYGWQLRGDWVARLYQPVFPAFLMAIARLTPRVAANRAWQIAVVAAIVVNASIAFGPVMMNPLAAWADYRFYRHSPPESMFVNLQRFGRRPLGVCSSSHQWDNLHDPHTQWNRPAYMFRYPPR